MNAFNEHGKPIQEIDDLAYELENMAREFLHNMVQQGYSGTEIRATAGYLSGAVDVAGSEAIFALSDKLRRDKIAQADKNLSPEEVALLKENRDNKIQAIRVYRDRTGLGLKESKDAIEAWLSSNK